MKQAELFCKSHNSWNIHFTSHQNLGKLQKHQPREISFWLLFSSSFCFEHKISPWTCSFFYFRSIESNRNCNILSTHISLMLHGDWVCVWLLLRNKYNRHHQRHSLDCNINCVTNHSVLRIAYFIMHWEVDDGNGVLWGDYKEYGLMISGDVKWFSASSSWIKNLLWISSANRSYGQSCLTSICLPQTFSFPLQ